MRHALIEQYYNSPEYLAKLRKKVKIMQEMEADEFLRQAKLLDVYSVDPVEFIEDFVMIKFMENSGQTKPFFLFPYQKKILQKLQESEFSNLDVDLLIDKPRGMGLTWLLAAYFLWRFLFTPNYSTLILSRKEDLVDDGTDIPDTTIFGKIRFMMKRLPPYMIPENFQHKKARGTITDMNLKMINPVMGSSIIGSSTNQNAGRSGRYRSIMIDECFFIENFQKVYNSLTSVAKLKVFISTVIESKMAENFRDACASQGNYISLTYKDHPFKDDQWYQDLVKRAEEMDNPDLLREAQVDYRLSPKSQYYPQISQAKIDDCVYIREKPVFMSLDVGGKQDLTVILWWQFDGRMFNILEAYENTNKPAEWYAPFMNPETQWNPDYYNEFQQTVLNRVRAWKKPAVVFGEMDHTVKRMPTNTSTADVLWKYGIKIIYNPYGIEHEPRRIATSQLLPKIVFNKQSDAVMKVYDAIGTTKYAQMVRTTQENLKPVHGNDGTADRRAAVENFCVNVGRVFKSQRDDVPEGDERGFAARMVKQLRV